MSRPFDHDDLSSPDAQTSQDEFATAARPDHTRHAPAAPGASGIAETADYIEAEYVEGEYQRHTDVQAQAESPAHAPHSSMRDTLTRIPDALGALGRTLERAISAKDDYVVAVKVSAEAHSKLEQLVQAGVFRSRAEAAAYLIDEGIIAQAALFARVDQKLAEIERLRAELRGMVVGNPNEGG